MKHLFIAAMIAILIGTIQAVSIRAVNQRADWDQLSCVFAGAHLIWSRGWFGRVGTEDVKGIIEGYRARGVREIRNDVAHFGNKDRAPGKEKKLRMQWKCCNGPARCSKGDTEYREGA